MKDKLGFNQIAFYVDMTLCTGCKTCMIACKDKNDLDVGVNWRRVVEYTGGEWLKEGNAWRQDIFSCYFSISCNHCNTPICVESCPTTALRKDENGIVSLDRDKCIGCRYCEWSCPYGAPQYDEKNKLMTKCDFCSDYLEEGRDPACVAACPTRALHFGEFEELQEKLSSRVSLAPLPRYELTDPALIIKPHRNAKPVDFMGGKISNPEEMRWNPKNGLW
jgi:anaerobic dimethyl sulfoxide reductase subunit B (iron-sulfur subunit)